MPDFVQSVDFRADGVEAVESEIESIRKQLDRVTDSENKAKKAAEGWVAALKKSTAAGVQKIGSAVLAGAQRFSIGGSLGLGAVGGAGAIAAGALRGTVEAERLGRALEYLVRVLGDELAPFVRQVTSGIVQLANAYRGLDPETRRAIAGFAILATGIVAVATAIPVVTAVFGGLITIFGTVGSAFGLVSSTTFVATAALAAFGAVALEAANNWEAASNKVDAFFENFWRWVSDLQFKASRGLGFLATWAAEKTGLMMPGALKGLQIDVGAEAKNRERRLNAPDQARRGIFAAIAALVGHMADLGSGIAGNGPGLTRQMSAAFDGGGLQTWQRLMQSLNESDMALADPAKEAVKQQKAMNEKLAEMKKLMGDLIQKIGKLIAVQ